MSLDRRDFLKVATAGAGLALGSTGSAEAADPKTTAPLVRSGQAADVIVIGAGNFGAWTALNLQRMGAQVTLVDQYGPGNSRSASGGETRGVRSSYGDRFNGLQWADWATRAMDAWRAWDEEHADDALQRLFYNSGDLILRSEMTPYLEDSAANWDLLGHDYEWLTPEEVRYRWPVIRTPDIEVALFEPSAGIVRARRAIESVASVFQREGGEIRIGRASPGESSGRSMAGVEIEGQGMLTGGTLVFALGPWFPKVFPELMGKRLSMRTMGHVMYFATPPGNESFRHPNLPSYNVLETTGWPALPGDSRGFRVRAGGSRGDDPDTSVRTVPAASEDRARQILGKYFPALAKLDVNETRACHYASAVSRNFVIDHHPEFDNVWLAGAGSAESFKQGPILGNYIAGRVMGTETDPELIEAFRLPTEEFDEAGLANMWADEFGSPELWPPFGRRGGR